MPFRPIKFNFEIYSIWYHLLYCTILTEILLKMKMFQDLSRVFEVVSVGLTRDRWLHFLSEKKICSVFYSQLTINCLGRDSLRVKGKHANFSTTDASVTYYFQLAFVDTFSYLCLNKNNVICSLLCS